MKLFRVEYYRGDQPSHVATNLRSLAVFTSSEKEARKKFKKYNSGAVIVSAGEVIDKSPKGLLRAFGVTILV